MADVVNAYEADMAGELHQPELWHSLSRLIRYYHRCWTVVTLHVLQLPFPQLAWTVGAAVRVPILVAG